MRTLVIFLEEPSARAMLEGLLPRVLPESVRPQYIVFEGKQDLDKRLESRRRGWCQADSLFMVIRDQDSGDCLKIKAILAEKCVAAGRPHALVRIACRELESWYLGDLPAVAAAFELPNLPRYSNTAKFRQPDQLGNPAEELNKLVHGRYQKMADSRALGPRLSLTENRSRSFQVLLEGIHRLVARDTLVD
jgi:Domain of unknown function (DUF4276)